MTGRPSTSTSTRRRPARIASAIAFFAAMLVGVPFGYGASSKTWLKGPVEARVLRVIDGDTIAVRAAIWPGQHIEVSVRLADVDAPEMRSRCKPTRDLAWRARTALHNRIAGTTVDLHDIRHGKYAGRVIARVRMTDGMMIADFLLSEGLAQPSSMSSRKRTRASRTCAPQARVALKP